MKKTTKREDIKQFLTYFNSLFLPSELVPELDENMPQIDQLKKVDIDFPSTM